MNILRNFMIVTIMLVMNACSTQNKSKKINLINDILSVSVHTYTRGSAKKLIISNQKLIQYNFQEKVASYNLPENQWQEINQMLGEINLDELGQLKVTSHGYASDSSMAEELTIVAGGKSYVSPTYDMGNEPDEIKPLVRYIKNLLPK